MAETDSQAPSDRSAAEHEQVLREVNQASAPETATGRRRKISVALMVLAATAAGAAIFWSFQQPVGEVAEPGPTSTAEEIVRQRLAAVNSGETTEIVINEVAVADEDLLPLRESTAIEMVKLDQGKVTDEGLKTLVTLPSLQHLWLRFSPITDDGLVLLADCEKLRILNLPQAHCTGDGLTALGSLEDLRQLRIGSDLAGNNICRAIGQLHSLRTVHLINIPITDEGLKRLVELPHLESLYLDGTAVSDAGWKWLFENHPHLHVHLDQRHHDADPSWHSH